MLERVVSTTKAVWRLSRPFTCLAPAVGVLSGTLAGLGAQARRTNRSPWEILEQLNDAGANGEPFQSWGTSLTLGVLAAVGLNIYSNAINQVCDIEIDRQSKPERPLVTGALSRGGAISVGLAALIASLVWAMGARPPGSRSAEFLICAFIAAVLTTIYSVPPIRLKRFGLAANFAIGLARGLLLKVAGWACLFAAMRPFDPEPWLLGGVFFLFTLGAVTTKDFADADADSAAGVRSLPVSWGATKAAWFAALCLSLPWAMLPLLGWWGFLQAPIGSLFGLGMLLLIYGGWTGWLLVRAPDSLGVDRNHPAWTHMYILMMAAQFGLAVVYLW